jgi:hypothetical protein
MTEGDVVNTLERRFGKHHVRPSPGICVLLVPYPGMDRQSVVLTWAQAAYVATHPEAH